MRLVSPPAGRAFVLVTTIIALGFFVARSWELLGSVTRVELSSGPAFVHGALQHDEAATVNSGAHGIFTCPDAALPFGMRWLSPYDLPQNIGLRIYEFTRSASGTSFIAEKDTSTTPAERWPGRRYGYGQDTLMTFLPGYTYYVAAEDNVSFCCTQALVSTGLQDINAMHQFAEDVYQSILDRQAARENRIVLIMPGADAAATAVQTAVATADAMHDAALMASFALSGSGVAASVQSIAAVTDRLAHERSSDMTAISGAFVHIRDDMQAARSAALDLKDQVLAASSAAAAATALADLELLSLFFDDASPHPDAFDSRITFEEGALTALMAAMPQTISQFTSLAASIDQILLSADALPEDLDALITALAPLVGVSSEHPSFRTDLDIDRDGDLSSIDYHYLRLMALVRLRASATVIHIDPYGRDDQSGLSLYMPVRTLARAQEIARGFSMESMNRNIAVVLRGGAYPDAVLQFDARDAGKNGYSVTYRAFPGDSVLFTGGFVWPE